MTTQEIPGYSSRECDRCNGTGRRFDITNVDNASGTVDASGKTRCTCIGGRIYVSHQSLVIQERDAAERAARLAASEVGPIPDWMI